MGKTQDPGCVQDVPSKKTQDPIPLLEVEDLKVSFATYAGTVHAVRGVSFFLGAGDSLALVGESGCGKSVTARAIMGLMKKPGRLEPGSAIRFKGRDLSTFSKEGLREYKGGEAALVFQEALSALDPTMRVGKQICEAVLAHSDVTAAEARERAIGLLREVGIPEPERRFSQFPHELSGGMRQRVMIAIAFAGAPDLLICDEPTTALDVTIQDQILEKIREIRARRGAAVLMITHDMGVVASIAQNMVVMYAGLVVEKGRTSDVFKSPRHPYTKALMRAVPRMDTAVGQELAAIPGSPPDLLDPPAGCPFCARCPYAMRACAKVMPPVTDFGDGHTASCWLHDPRSPKFDPELQGGEL